MNKRYVYFEKATGMITDILKTKKDSENLYVEEDLEKVLPILSGKKSTMEFVVAYDTTQEKYLMLERDNIIKLRYYGKDLYKIPNEVIEDYDLRIDIFEDGSALEISIDPTRMSTMYATDLYEKVKFEDGTELRIYLKDKTGSKLFRTLVIDAQRLLENGQLLYELKDIDPNDVSFYTQRVFNNYMWRKGKSRYASPSKNKLKFEIQKCDLKRRSDKYDYHLIISSSNKEIKIKNNIENVKLMKLFSDVEFYIVDRFDPTILYGKFILKPEEFKKADITIQITEDLKGKSILYNHSHISVLLEE